MNADFFQSMVYGTFYIDVFSGSMISARTFSFLSKSCKNSSFLLSPALSLSSLFHIRLLTEGRGDCYSAFNNLASVNLLVSDNW